MCAKQKKPSGREAFEEYYSSLLVERWQKIKEAFVKENTPVEYHIPGAEKSYFLDSASVLAALCLPLDESENILDLCAAPGGKTLVIASRMSSDAQTSAPRNASTALQPSFPNVFPNLFPAASWFPALMVPPGAAARPNALTASFLMRHVLLNATSLMTKSISRNGLYPA